MNCILFGFKSCGKTTFGKILAKRLRRSFIDTDRLINELYFERTKQNLSIKEIVKAIGVEQFRLLETDAIKQLGKKKDAIISLGGGAILNPQNLQILAQLGRLVYLKVNKETLKKRLLRRQLPSYLDPSDPEKSFENMYQDRLPQYEAITAEHVDVDRKSKNQVILELATLIEQWELSYGK